MAKPKKFDARLKGARSNIFYKYFILFAVIFVVSFTVLGASLMAVVNAYSLHEKTDLLRENTTSIADSVSRTLIINDMNSSYSYEKDAISKSLNVVSKCIDADLFVCDAGGNVILCKDQNGINSFYESSMVCPVHRGYRIPDAFIQNVYESGKIVSKTKLENRTCYIVGTAIKSQANPMSSSNIIGSVFAVVDSGTTDLVSDVFGVFFLIAAVCMLVGFILIWVLTKSMITPLQQMSVAAKSFALGDFSYRVKINGNDELADLGLAFNDMADALDKLENSRRSFVANVSHELKTPMTSIAGFIDGILDGTIPKDKQEYYLKIVSDEVRRLSRLVVAMLNMSKMESGEFEMKPKAYNVSDQIIHILLTFEQKIEKKNIEIRGLEDLQPHHIMADNDMIYQVIYNLLDNAVKFTNENGYIDICLKDAGDSVEFLFKNSGDGIDSNELVHIFERFYKIDKSRSLDAKGAGLGLYIVKTMIEMHGGKIYARSDNKSEAEFIFTLPKA